MPSVIRAVLEFLLRFAISNVTLHTVAIYERVFFGTGVARKSIVNHLITENLLKGMNYVIR